MKMAESCPENSEDGRELSGQVMKMAQSFPDK